MISSFGHSNRMSEEKSAIYQVHGDGFPCQRITSELKKFTNLVENIGANDSSSRGKSNANSLKMLLAKEMAKEGESKRRSPSVIAKLMGLHEDLPADEPTVYHATGGPTIDSKAINKALGKEHQQSIRLMAPVLQQFHVYKDVYEVCEEHSRTSSFQDQTSEIFWSSENKSEQSDIVQEKFMEPCSAMKEQLIHATELQDDLKISSSNNNFLLKFPEECNYSFSRKLSRLHTNQALPQTKRITVLKPVSSVEISGVGKSETERVNKQNGLKTRQFHQSNSTKEETPSQPSRIVVLRPTPGKPGISKAKLTPRTTSFQLLKHNNLNGLSYNGATLGSSGLVHGVKQHPCDGCHQRDDFLLFSAQSSGYVGDESSCGDSEFDQSSGSEIEYIDDAGGSGDSEGNSSPQKHSSNYIRRYESPYSGSSFHKVSHFPESSIINEAKKQLSERCAKVTCDNICQEQVQSSRRTRTLGEMLSIQEAKEEVFTTGILSVSSDTENEKTVVTSPRKLSRENSAPVISSMLENMLANVEHSNPERYNQKVVVDSDKGKLSFKGRVSDFFLSSRNKKPNMQKTAHHPSDFCAERVDAYVRGRPDHNLNRDADEKIVHFEDKVDCYSVKILNGTSKRTALIGVPLDCPSGDLDNLGVNKCLNSNQDQPSPTSVLDAPSEDSSCNEPETSRKTSKNAISRSSAVEAVSCSLSLDNTTSESELFCIRRPCSLISDADTDESESHVLVQNIMSSTGLGGAQSTMAFTGWHLSDYPLDPVLCNKILELREQSSYRRLLFDCVNVALVEIGENALLSSFPCSKAHSRTLRYASAPDLKVEVWGVLKDWIYGARMFVVSKKGNAGIMWDRIVKQEVEGRGWVKMMIMQVVDITEELEEGVMEELVEEAVLDFSACFQR